MKIQFLVLALSFALLGAQALAKEPGKTKFSREVLEQVAIKKVPGELLGWCLEMDNGVPTYSFEIKGEDFRINEVEVDADTGELQDIGIEIESCKKGGSIQKTKNLVDLARLKQVSVNQEQAQNKALKKFAGSVEIWELEFEEGRLVYEFLISTPTQSKVVGVDAKDGNITEVTQYLAGNSL